MCVKGKNPNTGWSRYYGMPKKRVRTNVKKYQNSALSMGVPKTGKNPKENTRVLAEWQNAAKC